MKRIVSAALAFVMAALFAFAPCQMKAEAASRLTTLKAGRTYNSFDITGDKRNDKFLIREYGSGDYKNDLRIFVNGKVAYHLQTNTGSHDTFYGTTAKLITLGNGKSFLFLSCLGDSDSGPVKAILRYTNGRFVRTVDFNALTEEYAGICVPDIKSVSGNTVNVKLYMMSFTTGMSDYTLKYFYKNGKLVQDSSKTKFLYAWKGGSKADTFKANRTIKVYTSVNCDKVAFTLKRGNTVKIMSPLRLSSRRVLYQVKFGNKYGWIIGQNRNSSQMFSDAYYAG